MKNDIYWLFKDLLEEIFQVDPDRRPSCTELLEHPFFKETYKSSYSIFKNLYYKLNHVTTAEN